MLRFVTMRLIVGNGQRRACVACRQFRFGHQCETLSRTANIEIHYAAGSRKVFVVVFDAQHLQSLG